ncbi:MAG: YihY/virulence factor BrkB family protein [Desulfuromonadales bacterium]|nr:YihY/virulence factor BrkB family protein [Desulfuromonadales bacterium]
MKAQRSVLERWRQFLEHDLWDARLSQASWWQRLLVHQGQLWTLVIRDFIADRCILRASALTFTTLLSIVPLLALMFAVLKAFGVQNELEPLLLEHLAAGSKTVVPQIIQYINNTNVARLGTIGLVLLVLTVLTLLSNIEQAFNRIWGVTETRPILRRFTDYFSVVTIGPVFVFAAISMTSGLQSQGLVQALLDQALIGELLLLLFKVLPFMVMWLVFAGLYLFIPNYRVSPKAALIGGIFGGTLWQLSQWGYVHFQVGVARYNAIYGTMAALPIFMVWIYFSWMIVLLGLEVTYAVQNLRSVRQDVRGNQISFASRRAVILGVLLYLGRCFHRGEPAPDQQRIVDYLGIAPRLLRDILDELQRLHLVAEVLSSPTQTGYQPAQALDTADLAEVLRRLRCDGEEYRHLRTTGENAAVDRLLQRLHDAEAVSLQGQTLRDLVMDVGEGEGD